MTIKTDHGTFECRELTFKDRRELHQLEVDCVIDEKVNMQQFLKVLDWVMEFAFDNPEQTLGHLDDNSIDEVLMAIYNSYKEPSKKK
jgi:hypothetical protein|tara:strand:+ start:143 stop:403 length:261 start_codon:yes stop_codon:yes gene_type:complete